ncbi:MULTISPECIES: ATP synthase subunit I [unclassified Breznakia]|uniref:ATP synthase subunit I n=1 Tax=unclassified Breznakia TaxID=2623764 RepID=UPI002405F0E5|nr:MULTISPECIES: ATP synthase subunit I [unclassified Breznakia]MDL2276667.1 ATP synthase subunit I [Breznakia sp. OttesenSCG-928-G09]
MQSEKMYKQIEYIALAIILVIAGIVMIVTQDWKALLGVVYGGVLNIIGFRWIVVSSKSILKSGNATRLATVHFVLRYLIYAVMLVVGMQVGLNIIFMLLGFFSINLAIKVYTIRTRKEV